MKTLLALAIFSLFAATAQAAGITVTDAKIAAGKLVVTGTTPRANQLIVLEDQFQVRSNGSAVFSFQVVYFPSDCVVGLKTGTATQTAVVAGCAVAPAQGVDINGAVSLSPVANGRCTQVLLSISGAKTNDLAIIAPKAAIQDGVVMYAEGSHTDGHVTMDICNFSGTSMTPISNLPIRLMTFR